jgi:hypothetical protein
MQHIPAIIMAIVAVMGGVGAGAKFIWNKIEKRFAEIDLKLDECEKREEQAHLRRTTHLAVIELLWAEMQRVHPKSAVLARAKKLMDDLKAKQID